MSVKLNVREALLLVLDQVDYTKGACTPTEMVGACLSTEVIATARASLVEDKPKQKKCTCVGLVHQRDCPKWVLPY